MPFTLRQLEYFVAAAESGSITEAALNIPVAQSSVSAAIAALEAALGVQLLIRHHAQGITPTAEGRLFAERARSLLREADELERFASELTSELSGTLNLGCLVTLAPLVAPHLGKGFRQQHDGVALKMVEAGQDELMAGLRAGQLSVALTYDLELSDGIAFSPLATLSPYALFAAGHPLAAKPSVTLAELADEPLVLLDLPSHVITSVACSPQRAPTRRSLTVRCTPRSFVRWSRTTSGTRSSTRDRRSPSRSTDGRWCHVRSPVIPAR